MKNSEALETTKTTETLEVLPDPKRMIEGLRDTGYEFNTAIADLIDNSIAAEATLVDIDIQMNYRGALRLSIADNGSGMNRNGLINAMKYGSVERPHPSSLGKFGLGLKTASTAFCRRLLVTSRKKKSEDPIRAYWDLDHVAKVAKWELLIDKSDATTLKHLQKVASESAGTVVVWEKIDRLMKIYKDPTGTPAQKALNRIVDELREHISMIYQRFLDRENTEVQNIDIKVNGQSLMAWDPFCEAESDMVAEQEVDVEGTNSSFILKAYVLPRNEEFSTPDAAKLAKVSTKYQGIYVYRENRLIHYADWLGMYSKEPHSNLLRVEFSFDHMLDDAFQVDIKKSQIILDSALYDYLKDNFLIAPRRAANDRYRQGQKKKANEKADNAHASSNSTIGAKVDEVDSSQITATGNDEATVRNAHGEFKLKLKSTTSRKPGELFIQPADSIEDGMLFEPVLIDNQKGVRINTSHPYYHKVYVPNLKSGVTVQGMDSLLWALCTAEFSTINDKTTTHFEELRYELSRILRKLVADLPDPELNDNEAN